MQIGGPPQLFILQFAFCNLQFLPTTSHAAPNVDPTEKAGTAGTERVVYEISRLRSFDDERLPIALITAAAIALVAIVWQFYRRDAIELTRGKRLSVMLLRCVALAGLVVFFLGIERRTTREIVHNSQVAVLVDVSQSMGLSENENSSNAGGVAN